MKYLLSFLLIVTIATFGNVAHSQTEIPLERKVTRMLNAEADIYRLPHDSDHIRFVIVPHIEAQRAILAPNYPITDNVFNEQLKGIIGQWIEDYPEEYEDFVLFMETYIRSNH